MGQPGEKNIPPVIEPTGISNKQKAIGSGAIMAGLLVLFLFDPVQSAFFPECMFLKTTGLLCPGCGATRLMHALMHGQFADAFSYNPFFMLTLLLISIIIADKIVRKGILMDKMLRPIPLIAYLSLSTLFGILRNIPHQVFDILRP